MDHAALRKFLEPINKQVQDFASFLDLSPSDRYTSVVADATEELVKLTVEMSAENFSAREEKNHAERESAKIRASIKGRNSRRLETSKNHKITLAAPLHDPHDGGFSGEQSLVAENQFRPSGLPDDLPAGF